MKDSYQNIIWITKNFIHNQESIFSDDVDFEDLLREAENHQLKGVAAYILAVNDQLPGHVHRQKFSCIAKQCYAYMALKAVQTDALGKVLSDAGIDYIPFKGYIIREYYPVPELRLYGDVDILIHPEDRQRCHQCLLQNGFICTQDWEPVYNYRKGISLFEIHTELLDTDISEKVSCRDFFRKNPWQFSVQRKGHMYEFIPEYHLVYLLTHIAKHAVGAGAGIRMYLDLAFFVRRTAELDWLWIEKTVQNIGLQEFTDYVWCFIKDVFDVPVPISFSRPSDEDFHDFIDYTMEAGIFGFAHRSSGVVELKNKMRGHAITKKGALVHRLFPSAKMIEPRYTYLQKCPWLLPVAWLHRFIITGNDTKKHFRQLEEIITADEMEIRRLKKVKDKLGL